MDNQSTIKGVRIRTFNRFIMVLSCILFILLLFTTASIPAKYHQLIQHTDEYISCERDAAMLSQASDYLTEQVRMYAQNMNIKHMNAYFEEANVTRRREKALEDLKKHDTEGEIHESLELALKSSNDLMEREIYSMKLISVANGYEPDILPQEVRDMPLTAADAALEREAMIEKARSLVFDEGYQDAKTLIYSHLSHFTENIMDATRQRQADSETVLLRMLSGQRIFISVLFLITLINFLVIAVLIIRPLSIHISHIKENKALEIVGSYEFKYLALTYNDIYELNAANAMMLTHKAEHDPLTGLMNRAAFDNLKSFFKDSMMPLALIVIDIDRFKMVNDRFGHECGDRILQSVATLLQGSFRTNDYVIRLGGDEFVVIMTEMTLEHADVIVKKIMKINTFLQNPKDDLPAVSLSAGAVFSEHGFPEDLFQKADRTLYQAKNEGRGRCCFYE